MKLHRSINSSRTHAKQQIHVALPRAPGTKYTSVVTNELGPHIWQDILVTFCKPAAGPSLRAAMSTASETFAQAHAHAFGSLSHSVRPRLAPTHLLLAMIGGARTNEKALAIQPMLLTSHRLLPGINRRCIWMFVVFLDVRIPRFDVGANSN